MSTEFKKRVPGAPSVGSTDPKLLVWAEILSIMAILLSMLALAMMVWMKPLVDWSVEVWPPAPAKTSAPQTSPQPQKQ